MGYSGAWGILIHEKKLKSKISSQTPFKLTKMANTNGIKMELVLPTSINQSVTGRTAVSPGLGSPVVEPARVELRVDEGAAGLEQALHAEGLLHVRPGAEVDGAVNVCYLTTHN